MNKKIKILEKKDVLNQLQIDLISRFHPLSNDDLIKYREILNFGRYQLILNDNINWNIEIIKSVKEKLDCTAFWKLKNISLDINFFDAFDDIIDYSTIHLSKNIEWSSDLISKYGHKFEWSKLSMRSEPLSEIEVLRKYKDLVDWKFASERLNLSFSEEIIEEFKEFWDWTKLSLNKNLPISLEFLERYKDYLDFDNLSRNPSCIDIILKYAKSKRWNWNNVIINPGLEYNDKIFQLVYYYYYKTFLGNINKNPFFNSILLSNFLKKIFHSPFTQKSFFLNEKFAKYYPWEKFSESNLEVDIDFINKFKDKINFKGRGFLKSNGKILNKDFILNNIELFDLSSYNFYYLNIDNEILEKNNKSINWSFLSRSESIKWSWELVSNNYEKLNLFSLSENKTAYNNLVKKVFSNEEIYSFLDSNINQIKQ